MKGAGEGGDPRNNNNFGQLTVNVSIYLIHRANLKHILKELNIAFRNKNWLARSPCFLLPFSFLDQMRAPSAKDWLRNLADLSLNDSRFHSRYWISVFSCIQHRQSTNLSIEISDAVVLLYLLCIAVEERKYDGLCICSLCRNNDNEVFNEVLMDSENATWEDDDERRELVVKSGGV